VAALTVTGGASVSALTVGPSGASITSVYSVMATVTFTSIVPGGTQAQTVAVPGCSIGDIVSLGLAAAPNTLVAFGAYIPTASVVAIQAYNYTTGTVTPGAQTIHAMTTGVSP
jgi:disulfide bond formation protein DsbB